ncbi:hypothetical protein, partial [Ilumatobacter sp.]|uniref:hypothetical protein n=1 Tax=Ilumatobacter sp. TaxID=1967498 RepID=UPI003AF8DDB1
MLESEEVLTRSEQDVRVDMRKDSASPTAEEVRAIVHGPRRPIRWMRWLGAFVLVVATAMVVTYATSSEVADPVRYQVPASVDATTEALTRSVYLPETSGEVYNYNPATVVPASAVYLPV